MATIVQQLERPFRAAIAAALDLDADPQIGVSQHPQFGDYQSNAAMGLAKVVADKTGKKTNPRAIAEQIKAKLDLGSIASEVSIAGPGFINVRLSPGWLGEQLQALRNLTPSPSTLGEGRGEGSSSQLDKRPSPQPSPGVPGEGEEVEDRLGIERVANPQTIVVDYSGPNIAKEMHVGHLRSTIIGDAISRVLEFQGHKIIRQNHIGDWGTQFGMLIEYLIGNFGLKKIWSAQFEIGDFNSFYQQAKAKFDADPDFAEQARKRVVMLQGGDPDTREGWRQLIIKSLGHFDDIYDRLDVKLLDTDLRGESEYNDRLPNTVAELGKMGIAVESEGAIVVHVPGYESPLIINKSDGGFLYGTTDLAAIRFRVRELHANRIIYVHDSRQSQHFAQLFWTAKKAGWADGVELDYAPFGTMLGEDGKPFKTRSGETVKLKDLLDEAEQRALKVVTDKNPELPEEQRKQIAHAVGIGGVKYSDLAKDRVADYVFSFDKMLALDGNTAPYLQYAHARIKSIFRKTSEKPGDTIHLDSPFELALAKHILRLGEILEIVARELKPHHLCTYLYELATRFSGFYENCPVLQSEPAIRASRLALCELTARTMKQGLDLLGIETPEQM